MMRGFFAAAMWLLASAFPLQAAEFLPPEQAFPFTVRQEGGEVRLRWDIREGYYLYRDKIKVEGDAAAGIEVAPLPAGESHSDEFFGPSEVYRAALDISVRPAGARALEITWQGCADAGLCYPPQSRRIEVAAGAGTVAAPAAPAGEDQGIAGRLSNASLAWMALVFFGLGLLMTFTPCVLPMVPIVSSLVVGAGAGARRGFALSVAFVLPMALTYAALGAGAALAGANLQAALQNPWLLGAFALVFVALAFAMFGVYELQLPAALRDRLDRAGAGRKGGSLKGAAVMGLLSALLVGPCMTAPLAGALLYIGKTGDVATGGLALFALGLGMGAPLVAVGTLGARLLPRPGAWMNRVKTIFGFVLLGTAISFLARVLPAALTLALWGALALAFAVSLAAATRGAGGGVRRAAVLASVPFALWSVALFVGAAGGAQDPLRPLAFDGRPSQGPRFEAVRSPAELDRRIAEARASGRWTLVDVYADWCVSCKVIEEEVFPDPRVRAALSGMQLLRADVTANNAADQALLAEHGILGPPTLLLIGPDGRERRADRVVGEIGAEELLARIERARRGS